MSKSGSGYFKGTKGAKSSTLSVGDRTNGKVSPLFRNGHVTYSGISAHREEFMGKSVEQIAKMLKNNGYEVNIRPSKNAKKGSTAKIIEITNPSKERNIKQVQVSPDGSRRHGNVPYVKISTSDKGKIKIIEGTRKEYDTDGNENARLYFKRRKKKK